MSSVIPIQEPIFAFTSGETFQEFCHAQPLELGGLLRRVFAGTRIDPETQLYLATYPNWLTCVVIVEDQTPDTVMIVPILARIADACSRMDMRILTTTMDLTAINDLADDDLDLEEYLDDIDLPLVIFFDEEWNQQARWGPRPAAAEKRLEEWLAAHPVYARLLEDEESEDSPELEQLVDELTHRMRLWYKDDLTGACVGEIRAILERLEAR